MKFHYSYSTRIVFMASIVATTVMLFVGTPRSIAAADGDLDATFGSAGKVITDVFGRSDGANAIALQSNGKIVPAGSTTSAAGPTDVPIASSNNDGSLDTSFG